MVFTEPEVNPCLRMLMSAAMRQAGLAPRDPFQPGSQVSLGKPGLMDDLMQQAGFRSVATPWMKVPFRLPTTDDYLTVIKDPPGPIQQLLALLDEAARAAARVDIAARLDALQTADGWIGPNTPLLTEGKEDGI